ncbi:MAG: 4Fe-4S ferredoxin, iron-sulfur binding domain protein [Proteobacteria bacterium]|jgi:ferredoxin|nr:4Fe-4S ferredoxin, iron-sulfur binding domain protein [Pseudomonadota bacterium]
MAMTIDPDACSVCGDCKPACPSGAVVKIKGIFSIDANVCDECDGDPQCMSVCPSDCIQPL